MVKVEQQLLLSLFIYGGKIPSHYYSIYMANHSEHLPFKVVPSCQHFGPKLVKLDHHFLKPVFLKCVSWPNKEYFDFCCINKIGQLISSLEKPNPLIST